MYALDLALIKGLVGVRMGMGVTEDVHRDTVLLTIRKLQGGI